MGDVYVRCPSLACSQVLCVSEASRGMLVTCRFCKRALRVPPARPAAAAAPPGTASNRPMKTAQAAR